VRACGRGSDERRVVLRYSPLQWRSSSTRWFSCSLGRFWQPFSMVRKRVECMTPLSCLSDISEGGTCAERHGELRVNIVRNVFAPFSTVASGAGRIRFPSSGKDKASGCCPGDPSSDSSRLVADSWNGKNHSHLHGFYDFSYLETRHTCNPTFVAWILENPNLFVTIKCVRPLRELSS